MLAGLGTVTFSEIDRSTLDGDAADLVITLPSRRGQHHAGRRRRAQDANGNTANTARFTTVPARPTRSSSPSSPTRRTRCGSIAAARADDLTCSTWSPPACAPSLKIGDAASEFDQVTFSGPITVSADIGITAATALHLVTGGSVSYDSGTIAAESLGVEAGGDMSLADRMTSIPLLRQPQAIICSSRIFDGFLVGSVDGIHGVVITVADCDASRSLDGPLTVSDTPADREIDTTGTLFLTAGGDERTLTIASGANVRALFAAAFNADKMNLAGTIDAGDLLGLFPRSAQSIDLGSTTDGTLNTLELSDSELDRITAGRAPDWLWHDRGDQHQPGD